MNILIRLAGNPLMLRIQAGEGFDARTLARLATRMRLGTFHSPTLEALIRCLNAEGFRDISAPAGVLNLRGDEDMLLRVDPGKQVLVRTCGPRYRKSPDWSTAPVTHVFEPGCTWIAGRDVSRGQLKSLEQDVMDKTPAGPLRDALLAILKVGRA